MKTYTILENAPGHRDSEGRYHREQTLRHKVSEEGGLLIWAAYYKLYGNCQSMETREKRGGIAWVSEIKHWIEQKALPADFDWIKYKVGSATPY